MTKEKPKHPSRLLIQEGKTIKLIESVFKKIPDEEKVMPYRYCPDKGANKPVYYIVDEKTLRERIKNGDSLDNVCTSLVTDMSELFRDRKMLRDRKLYKQDLSSWDTSNVKTMRNMFYLAESFNQDIGVWDTGKVTNVKSMFSNAKNFNANIGRWNTSNVKTMENMFYKAESFNQRHDNQI
ncbi:MAG: BspA family leucine-rich repeat surface protein [Flavobacteriaceae bacterium]|nr:BspA family leucine-rich repeat surface protein [Flavobacteriaceae bacterium]